MDWENVKLDLNKTKVVKHLIVGVISLGVIVADIAGVSIDRFFVGLAICLLLWVVFGAVLSFAIEYQFRRTHTPEERAALASRQELRRDRRKFATDATLDKREVLRTGAEARAVVTAADGSLGSDEDKGDLFYLELAVTVGTDAPSVVRTGEYLSTNYVNAVKVGRELPVRVDPDNRKRVAVDWKWVEKHLAVNRKQAEQQRQSPAWRQEQIAQRLQALETLCGKGAISDAEYMAMRDQVMADS